VAPFSGDDKGAVIRRDSISTAFDEDGRAVKIRGDGEDTLVRSDPDEPFEEGEGVDGAQEQGQEPNRCERCRGRSHERCS
jgi:hypothetical protein